MTDWSIVSNMIVPLLVAVLLGGLVGLEREIRGQWAGLRTHMMVSMAAAIFVVTQQAVPQATPADLSRVIQGVAAGIGFIGAGTIIKLTDRLEIKGLTTASTIWLAAAIGIAAGTKMYVLGLLGALLSLGVLVGLRHVERYLSPDLPDKTDNNKKGSQKSEPEARN